MESIAENMHFFPPERYLDGDDLMFEYDPDTIKQCTDALGKFLFLMYFELGYPRTIYILHSTVIIIIFIKYIVTDYKYLSC